MCYEGSALRESFFWLVWLCGPASYGAAFVYYVIPGRYGADAGLACIMVGTHLVAAVGTLVLFLGPGPRRNLECWLLLPIYWVGIGIWVLPALFGEQPSWAPLAAYYSTRLSAVVVVLIPVVRLLRLLLPRAA